MPYGFYHLTDADLSPAPIRAEEFLELTDPEGTSTPDANILTAAVNAGESWLHAYVSRRYKLPLDLSDAVLAGFIKPMLADRIHLALLPRADMVSRELMNRITSHEELLGLIRDGQADLPASSPPPEAGAEVKIVSSIPPRTFTQLP